MIAVTGASGFVGSHVLWALVKRKRPFVLLTRSSITIEGISSEQIRRVDFTRTEDIALALAGCSEILHLAGRINGSAEDLEEANPRLIQRIVDAAPVAGVRRIVYVSSAAAVFRHGPYGQSKGQAEEILQNSGISYLIFRPTLLYGQGDTKNIAMIEKWIRRFPVFPLLGGGTFLIQPLFIEDAVEILMRALESSLENKIYNLAGPKQISLRQIIAILAAAQGRRPRLIPVPLKPVQLMATIWSALFPRTTLPVKQVMELDKHAAFDITDTQKDFRVSPRPFMQGIRDWKGSPERCAV